MMRLLQALLGLFNRGVRPEEGAGKSHERKADDSRGHESAENRAAETGRAGELGAAVHPEISREAIRANTDRVNIWAGLDFGTSSIKAAYKRMDTNRVYAIDFGHDLQSYPSYCLPSVLTFLDRKILLGVDAAQYLRTQSWDGGVRRLKILVASEVSEDFEEPHTTEKCSQLVAEYNDITGERWDFSALAALLIAHAMNEIWLRIRRDVGKANIDVRFNVCVPIDYVEKSEVRRTFKRIVEVAYHLFAATPGSELSANSARVRTLFDSWVDSEDNTHKRAFIVPESVAEIASYLTSLGVRRGIHALIDFGAGTTDISVFNLMGSDGSQNSPVWYSACVIPRGAHFSERVIAEHLRSTGKVHTQPSEIDIVEVMRNLDKEERPLRDKIRKELELLWEETRSTWGLAFGHLKSQSEWTRDKVKIMVSGGACRLPDIKLVFGESWMDSGRRDWGPYNVEVVSPPDNYFVNPGQFPFERMAVAYGLTIPEPELGEYILPSKAPNHTPPPLPLREGRHNPGWTNY